MYYLTVGYPLGSDIVENRLVFQVSLKKQTVQLIPLEYRIWGRFLLGAYGEEVEKSLPEADLRGFSPTMNKLIQTGLLASFPDGDYAQMKPLKFMRQGIGEGLDLQTNAYSVMFRGKVELSPLEYDVWREADGEISYREIERRVILKRRIPAFEAETSVFGLCRRGLLLAVNREER